MFRKAVVAGSFYPKDKEGLEAEIANYIIPPQAERVDAIGVLTPHAGYAYSGQTSASVYSSILPGNTFLILGLNHHGYGRAPFALMKQGVWQTPLGQVLVDTELSEDLLDQSAYLQDDPAAHQYEHSIEVQLPFLQYFFKNAFHILPISINYSDYEPEIYKKLGTEIAEVIKRSNKKVVVIASSDMSHEAMLNAKTYQERVINKDREAINAILELDEEKLLYRLKAMNITMCGYAPAAIMLVIAKNLGAQEAKLIKYTTSFEVRHDYEYVVGYAGIIVK